MGIKGDKRDTLCSNNMVVKDNLTTLRAMLRKLNVQDPKIFTLIDESRNTLKIMKTQGQKMENRLYKYHEALCKLGFKRIRKKKKREN